MVFQGSKLNRCLKEWPWMHMSPPRQPKACLPNHPSLWRQGCPHHLQHKWLQAFSSSDTSIMKPKHLGTLLLLLLGFGMEHSKGSKFRNWRCSRAFGSQPYCRLQRKQSNFTSTPLNPRPVLVAVSTGCSPWQEGCLRWAAARLSPPTLAAMSTSSAC